VGHYVLTAENLITGSLADDDVAMGGYHIGIHRPSGSGSGGIAAARPQEEGCMAVITRGFGDRLDRLVFLVGWHVGVRGELDGTKNFVSGLPLFATSSGCPLTTCSSGCSRYSRRRRGSFTPS